MRISDDLHGLWLAIGLGVSAVLVMGCGGSESEARQPTESDSVTVFVCRESGDVFVGSTQPTPAQNPKTGKASLMRGLYCPQCQKWYAGPPLDELQRKRGGGLCPKDRKTPMRLDGPVPDSAQRLPDTAESVR